MLRTRVLSALVLVPVVGLAVWLGGWWLFGVLVLVAGMAGYECSRLMHRGGHSPSTPLVLLIVGVFLLDAQLPWIGIASVGVVWILLLSISWQLFRPRLASPTVDWALTIAGGLYVGLLTSYMIRLRSLPDGLAWTAFALLVTWASDSGAYFVGRAIGRHSLCRRLSPGKTWEGIGGGLLAGLLGGAVVGAWCMTWLGAVGLFHGLVAGLLVAVVCPFGDLAVSMMKREVQAKDSGHLIPGHGGVLDRIDSLMFVAVIVYYYAIWLAG